MEFLTEPLFALWLVPLVLWEAVWKGVGLWKSARNNQLSWFLAILVLNTVGIVPILYILFWQRKAQVQPAQGSGTTAN